MFEQDGRNLMFKLMRVYKRQYSPVIFIVFLFPIFSIKAIYTVLAKASYFKLLCEVNIISNLFKFFEHQIVLRLATKLRVNKTYWRHYGIKCNKV